MSRSKNMELMIAITERNKKIKFDNNYSISHKLLMVPYLFYGFILVFLGNNIENFIENIGFLQKTGLFLVLLGLTVYSYNPIRLKKYMTKKTKFRYIIMTVTLIMVINVIFSSKLLVKTNLAIIFGAILLIFFAYTIFILLIELVMRISILIKNIDESIDNPTEKTMILIAFFGVLISLITLLK